MDIFGYPVWVVLLVCFGVFCASFMDALGYGRAIPKAGVAFCVAGDCSDPFAKERPAGKVLLEFLGIA